MISQSLWLILLGCCCLAVAYPTEMALNHAMQAKAQLNPTHSPKVASSLWHHLRGFDSIHTDYTQHIGRHDGDLVVVKGGLGRLGQGVLDLYNLTLVSKHATDFVIDISGAKPGWPEALLALGNVRLIKTPSRVFRRQDERTQAVPFYTTGVFAHNVNQARTFEPTFNGAGLKVGVISNGVIGLAAVQAAGHLPNVTVLNAGTSGSEGVAMLEIVYGMAPEADLFFYSGDGNSHGALIDAIQGLSNAGCDIIVDDLLFEDELIYQDDDIATAASVVANTPGKYYFSAAGNFGNSAISVSAFLQGSMPAHDGFLNLTISIATSSLYSILLQVARSTTVVAASEFYLQVEGGFFFNTVGEPWTGFGINAGSAGSLNISVGNLACPPGTPFTLYVLGNDGITAWVLGADVNTPSIFGHAAADKVFGVAAAPAPNGQSSFAGQYDLGQMVLVEYYSSQGPRTVFFDFDGNLLNTTNSNVTLTSGGITRKTPFATGADGVANSVFSPLFYGTSAAAPHLAALAACMISFKSDVNVAAVLQASVVPASDNNVAGHWDQASGYGVVDALLILDNINGGHSAASAVPHPVWRDLFPVFLVMVYFFL